MVTVRLVMVLVMMEIVTGILVVNIFYLIVRDEVMIVMMMVVIKILATISVVVVAVRLQQKQAEVAAGTSADRAERTTA